MSLDDELAQLEIAGWQFGPVVSAVAENPALGIRVVEAMFRKHHDGGTVLDALLSFVPRDDFPALVELAMSVLAQEGGGCAEGVGAILSYASLQHAESLRPHLRALWGRNPNGETYYGTWPWRIADDIEVARLERLADDERTDADERRDAVNALLETRREPVVRRRLSGLNAVATDASLQSVGLTRDGDALRQLYPDPSFHLLFARDYRRQQLRWIAGDPVHHPTWDPQDEVTSTVRFGGLASGSCGSCGGELHHLVTLVRELGELGVSGSDRLAIATCLSCLGWEREQLHYVHDVDGEPADATHRGLFVVPKFPSGPLRETTCRVTRTSSRWRWQDWALANDRENLNRLGGHPCWVQSADYPSCSGCRADMRFLLQLDGDLPLAGGDEHLWGSGGLCYVFWCDACRRSALHWQCT